MTTKERRRRRSDERFERLTLPMTLAATTPRLLQRRAVRGRAALFRVRARERDQEKKAHERELALAAAPQHSLSEKEKNKVCGFRS